MRRLRASALVRGLTSQRGMTIIELLMAAAIGLVVLGVTWGAVAVQGRSAAFQTGFADAQMSGRGTGTVLAQDLRMAGYGMLGVRKEENLPPFAYDESGGVTTLTLRGAFNNVQTTLAASAPAGSNQVTVVPPTEGSFVVGEKALVDSGIDSEVKTITSVQTVGANLSIGLDSALAHAYPIGPNVTQLEEVVYSWNGALMTRNNQVVADNASTFDLQFVDQDGGLAVTPGDDLRAVLLDLVAADPRPMPGNPVAHSPVSTEVNVRNLAFRWSIH